MAITSLSTPPIPTPTAAPTSALPQAATFPLCDPPKDDVCLSTPTCPPSSCPPSLTSCPSPAAPPDSLANARRIGRGIAMGVATGLVGCVPALGLLVHIKAAEAAADLHIQPTAVASVLGTISSALALVSLCGGDPSASVALLGTSGALGVVSGYCFGARA